GLSELWWRWRPRSRFALPRPAIVGVGAGLVAMVAASVATAPFAPIETQYPTAARAKLAGTSGNLLNEYDWGGYLIWRVPERPVFIDGRLFLFLPDVLTDYEEMVFMRPGWRDQLDRHAIAQVLLRPDRPLVAALRDLGWTGVSEDKTALLMQRPSRRDPLSRSARSSGSSCSPHSRSDRIARSSRCSRHFPRSGSRVSRGRIGPSSSDSSASRS